MSTSQYLRGTVVKCLFPFDNNPDQPGPTPHYCLFAKEYWLNGMMYLVVCYGTSQLDEQLLAHHAGSILSVPTSMIKGSEIPGPVTHFIGDHIALIPCTPKFVYQSFSARFDFMREETRKADPKRRRLYTEFEAFEKVMNMARDEYFENIDPEQIGLPPGKTLR